MIEINEVKMALFKALNYFSINRLEEIQVFEMTEHMVMLCGILKADVKDEICKKIDVETKAYNISMKKMIEYVELNALDVISKTDTINRKSYHKIGILKSIIAKIISGYATENDWFSK